MKFYSPENFIDCERIKKAKRFAVIVLNRPVNAEKEIVECLWNHGEILWVLCELESFILYHNFIY